MLNTSDPNNLNDPGNPRIPDYDIQGSLGSKESLAFRAIHRPSNRNVVVKIFPQVSTSARLSYNAELEANHRLGGHAGILPLLDHGSERNINFIVTEYLSGGTLRDILREHTDGMTLDEALSLFRPIAEAIDYIHDRHIIHRDLKPENIIIRRSTTGEQKDIQPYITDFGISTTLEESTSDLTGTGSIYGTFRYMAPEIWEGDKITPAVDIYALGVMLYESIEGKTPFSARTLASILRQDTVEEPPVPQKLLSRNGRRTVNALLRSLDNQPGRRQKSALELISDLGNDEHAAESFFTEILSWQPGRSGTLPRIWPPWRKPPKTPGSDPTD
jgi:eukaryotic-like serine/threonine-protein kinase